MSAVYWNRADTHGWTCDKCKKERWGCTSPQHAINSANLHNRQHHPEPVLNLTAMARQIAPEGETVTQAGLSAWAALTGLERSAAQEFLAAVLAEPEDVILHVAPF